jgi:hypothetical protein
MELQDEVQDSISISPPERTSCIPRLQHAAQVVCTHGMRVDLVPSRYRANNELPAVRCSVVVQCSK